MAEKKFLINDFRNPPAEYRGTPFWAWNTKLQEEELEEQIAQFQEMGMGGFYIHTRVGLRTPYMGREYLNCVRKSLEIAKKKGLYCCLYDEDRWPSGYGGGLVTEEHQYRSKYLLITPYKKGTRQYDIGEGDSQAASYPQGNGIFQAAYQIKLDAEGCLLSYFKCEEDGEAGVDFTKWYVYVETAHDSPWFNNQAYVDTLNPRAIRKFIDTTYESYYRMAGEAFGGQIPTIFTDEPQFARKKSLGSARNMEEIILPYTEDFAESYLKVYGKDFWESVPELLWELPGEALSIPRHHYHDHVTQRFTDAYGMQISGWCREHGIKLTGHMMEEPTLESQTRALGEVMRSMKDFALPGVDMLCDTREYTTVKQAASLAHQYGREGVLSEIYGVTNWDFDFRKHKLQGDWQAALGVTNRVHHLTWMSMGGEAKRDYPASIGRQSPWYKKYNKIETHFARLNTALQSGKQVIKVGVIHPIESYWLLFGPKNQTSQKRKELEASFQNITEWLLFHMIDFDYISESILPEQYKSGCVGQMAYEVIIVPECITLRRTTMEILRDFKAGGKKVVFMGKIPQCLDAGCNPDMQELAAECTRIAFSEAALLDTLEPYRFLKLHYLGSKFLKKPNHKKDWGGEETNKYLYQLRKEGEDYWLFLANGRAAENEDLTLSDNLQLEIKGFWEVQKYNTLDGIINQVDFQHENGSTIIWFTVHEHDSHLLRLIPAIYERPRGEPLKIEAQSEEQNLSFVQVQLQQEEPNVLVLDMPEYFYNGVWHEKEEILRIDNKLRKEIGYPLRRAALAQPWVNHSKITKTKPLLIKYSILCRTDVAVSHLAMEEAEHINVLIDGKQVEKIYDGYYVDSSISKIIVPEQKKGIHEILLEVPFSPEINLEACYLLGDFSVSVCGSCCQLEERKVEGYWGSITKQGLPFYGGNVKYICKIKLEAGNYEIQVSKFRAPLIQVLIDGKSVGEICFSPYILSFMIRKSGIHKIELISYGNRINTFGTLHNCDEKEVYFDPNAWRTEGEEWSYEYQIQECGILKAPIIRKRLEKEFDESSQSK